MARKAGSEDEELGNHTHNDPPAPLTDQERADLLLVHLATHRRIDHELEEAMNVVRGINKRRKRHRNDVKADGFLLKYVDEVLHDEKKARHENEDDAANRTFIRRVARMPVTGGEEDQLDLFSAKTSKGDVTLDGDDAHWAGVAMTIALRGGDVSAAANGVPPERIQAWEQGLEAGYSTFKLAQKTFTEVEKRRETTGA